MVLSKKHEKILEILKANPFIQQKKLSEIIGLSRSATANLISQLIDEGYLLGKAYVINESRNELIICVGGANIDSKMILENNVKLYTSNPVSEEVSVGGIARNIAENLGRLGRKVSLMSIIGNDENGRFLFSQSTPFMIMNHTQIIVNERTGRYTAVIQKDGELIVGLADMSICKRMDANWIDFNRSHLLSAKFVVADTNIMQSAFEQLITISKETGMRLIICGVTAAKMSRIPSNIQGVYLVIANVSESQAYLKTNETDLYNIVKLWLKKGVSNVIVTSSTSAVGYGHQNEIRVDKPSKTYKITDINRTSDRFASGFLYGLSKDLSFEESLEYGKLTALLANQLGDTIRKDLSSQFIEKELEKYRTKEKKDPS